MKLVWPAAEYLSGYINALEQGWSPDNRRAEAAQEATQTASVTGFSSSKSQHYNHA